MKDEWWLIMINTHYILDFHSAGMDISYKFLKLDLHTVYTYLVPPIKTRSPVVKAVKLMAWRQAKSPLKITTWSDGQRSASQIS